MCREIGISESEGMALSLCVPLKWLKKELELLVAQRQDGINLACSARGEVACQQCNTHCLVYATGQACAMASTDSREQRTVLQAETQGSAPADECPRSTDVLASEGRDVYVGEALDPQLECSSGSM